MTDPESVAEAFHETYERLAPNYGYKTREASAVPWSEVPDGNRKLMTAVVAELIEQGAISAPHPNRNSMTRTDHRRPPWHTITVEATTWHMTHPITCNLDACKFDAIARDWPQPPADMGRYRWHEPTGHLEADA